MTTLRFVALDLGTSAAGIAHTHDRHGAAKLGCRTVEAPAPMAIHKRIHRVLEDVEVAVRCKPHLVVVEGTFSRPGSSDGPLHMLRGVILHWLWAHKVAYVDVAPKTLKVWATGSGDAPKRRDKGADGVWREGVVEAVTATYGGLVHIATTDEADAVALLGMAADVYGQPIAPVRDHRRRALKVPKWPNLATEAGPVVPAVTR